MLKSDMCVLSKLHPSVCYNLGECKNDPGGYFIISEKKKQLFHKKIEQTIFYMLKINLMKFILTQQKYACRRCLKAS